jgi:hypothetical protein
MGNHSQYASCCTVVALAQSYNFGCFFTGQGALERSGKSGNRVRS